MSKGIFISMEGPDGAGKSTQIALLKDYLSTKGYDIIITREPGGTSISEKIRNIILDKNHKEMADNTELLLYTAARAKLVEEVIKPALSSGKAVISDRFVDSAAVYQGIARNMGIDEVYAVNEYALQGLMPDVTIMLLLSAEEGIRRKKCQAVLDRMEAEGLEFHRKVVDGYRILAERFPERIASIDATKDVQTIHKEMIAIIEDKL